MRKPIVSKLFPAMLSALLIVVALAVGSCASGASGASSAERAAPSTAASLDPLMEFTGLWTGTSTSNSNAKVRITLDMQREGNHLKGRYICQPLNAACRNNNQHGWVRAKTDARGFTVSMEDTSWCAFRLQQFNVQMGDGEYTCYMGGNMVDQGVFHIRRSPATPPPLRKHG